jgi:hypothetical protein
MGTVRKEGRTIFKSEHVSGRGAGVVN